MKIIRQAKTQPHWSSTLPDVLSNQSHNSKTKGKGVSAYKAWQKGNCIYWMFTFHPQLKSYAQPAQMSDIIIQYLGDEVANYRPFGVKNVILTNKCNSHWVVQISFVEFLKLKFRLTNSWILWPFWNFPLILKGQVVQNPRPQVMSEIGFYDNPENMKHRIIKNLKTLSQPYL